MTTQQIARQITMMRVEALIPYAKNARTHSAEQVAQIAASIRSFGFTQPVLVDGDGVIVAGHGRVMGAREAGLAEVPTIRVDWLTDAQRRAYILADNKIALNSGWDEALLSAEMKELSGLGVDMSAIGFDEDELAGLLAGIAPGSTDEKPREDQRSAAGMDKAAASSSLASRFMIPPFSVLNAREGWWQDRKTAWLSLGIKSEVGRGFAGAAPGGSPRPAATNYASGARGAGNGEQMSAKDKRAARQTASLKGGLTVSTTTDPYRKSKSKPIEPGRIVVLDPGEDAAPAEGADTYESGTSIFDPVLCEIAYRWFCPPAGTILDPFAGGSVRGVVASRLGRKYIGGELRVEQVAANRAQARAICADAALPPSWIDGDSRDIDKSCADVEADFVFSCPPYADLEVYSDDPRDLSTMDYPAFRVAYAEIIRKSCDRLRADRFACFVVGDVRDKRGNYYNLVGDTVEAFRSAGLAFYNEAILVTHLGSLPLRVGKQFSGSRKLGKTHQNVLVFLKGDAKRAVEACGAVEVPDEALLKAPEEGDGLPSDLSKYGEVMQ